jgi:hypothetical protein
MVKYTLFGKKKIKNKIDLIFIKKTINQIKFSNKERAEKITKFVKKNRGRKSNLKKIHLKIEKRKFTVTM